MNNILRSIFELFYSTGAICVAVRNDVKGVELPPPFLAEPQALLLHYGLSLPKPTEDCEATEAGIRCATLSFGGVEHPTFIPWEAVVSMAPGNPGEMHDCMLQIRHPHPIGAYPNGVKRGPFRVIDGGKDD